MSVLLRVDRVRPVQIDAILPRIGAALKDILGLKREPRLVATKMYRLDDILPGTYCINPGATNIGIRVDGEVAAVSVFSREGIDHLVISPDCWRTNLESALAAAVAIALAEHSETEISDSALAYTTTFSQSADSFAESVRVDKTFDNINEAAEAFFAGLRVGSTQ